MSPDQPASTMRSLERAFDVLDVLTRGPVPMRLSEIARRAGLHIATTQRILTVLEGRGYAEKSELGYRVGLTPLFPAHSYLTNNPLSAAAATVLQELATATGLTASLFVRSGRDRVVISRVPGARVLRYQLPIGERMPLHAGAGKVLAADMDQADLDDLLTATGTITRVTGEVITHERLHEELARIRRDGYSVSVNERAIGVTSVAAPVNDAAGRAVAAAAVTGLSEEVPEERFHPLVAEVQRAADAITRRLI
ncbi:IclR family transcriptional regulator [Nocardiopsis mangrovi]|uniref:IclR family transcriptional regulator n=1 Tax=Nocardiopsis mangrovi TaxID=1179818 RepID=A0ABV9E2Z3_9ACTN